MQRELTWYISTDLCSLQTSMVLVMNSAAPVVIFALQRKRRNRNRPPRAARSKNQPRSKKDKVRCLLWAVYSQDRWCLDSGPTQCGARRWGQANDQSQSYQVIWRIRDMVRELDPQ